MSKSKLYIGVMSGTSLDGIDIALCQIDKKECITIATGEYKFDKDLKKEILHIINGKTHIMQIGVLNIKLGNLFAKAINKFIKTNNIDSNSVEAIGLHGQTLWHKPDGDFPFSMQLGCPNIVSAKTGIKVVADFRSMDIANGGQGAPFTPAFHKEMFSHLGENIAVLNIGGISNITILSSQVKGWDCGPGNVLMDLWISKSKKLPFDKDGKFASSGKVDDKLLDSLLADNYFHLDGPKSTGREKFNKKYLHKNLADFQHLKDKDIQRTLLELTAKTIVKDVLANKIKKLIVCGGGNKNLALMKRLRKLSKIEVVKSDDFGIDSEFLEAMAFAWLAYKRVNNEKVDLSSVTGANKNSILGGIYG